MAIVNPQYQRFVKQVSLGTAMSKYSYKAMQKTLVQKIRSSAWRQSSAPWYQVENPINKVTDGSQVENNPYTTYLDDRFDAYKQCGDASQETGKMCAYAGIVCYRLHLPSSGYTWGPSGSKVQIPVQTDRYLRAGARIAWNFSNDNMGPSDDWDLVRNGLNGNSHSESDTTDLLDGVSSWGFCSQKGVEWTVSGEPKSGTFEFTVGADTATDWKYLDIYLTLEDPEEVWVDYDGSNPRWYSIEGAVQLVGREITVDFGSVVSTNISGAYCLSLNNRATIAPTGYMHRHFGPFSWICNASSVFVDPNVPYFTDSASTWSYWPKHLWEGRTSPSSLNTIYLDGATVKTKTWDDRDVGYCSPYCSLKDVSPAYDIGTALESLDDSTKYPTCHLVQTLRGSSTAWCGCIASIYLGTVARVEDTSAADGSNWTWSSSVESGKLLDSGSGRITTLNTAALYTVQSENVRLSMTRLGVKVSPLNLKKAGAAQTGWICDGMKVNVWCSSSRDACCGAWQHSLASVLMADSKAYGDGADDITTTLTGTGDLVQGVQLNATWEFAGSFDVTGETKYTEQIVMESGVPLQAGMVLAFVPVLGGGLTTTSFADNFDIGCTIMSVVASV